MAGAWCACGVAGGLIRAGDEGPRWRDLAVSALLGPAAVLAALAVDRWLPPEAFGERRLRPIPVRVRDRRRRR